MFLTVLGLQELGSVLLSELCTVYTATQLQPTAITYLTTSTAVSPAARQPAMRPLALALSMLLLALGTVQLIQTVAAPTAAGQDPPGNAKDIGEHGKRDSQYYKWQRDKETVADKAAEAKERQLAREAQAGGRRQAELTAEEKELQGLRRAITRREQYKREAIEAENFEEAARLRDEIAASTEELRLLEAEAKAGGSAPSAECEETEHDDEEDDEEELVVGADGVPIVSASEEPDAGEDYTARCPDGYYDHDKDHRTRAPPTAASLFLPAPPIQRHALTD